MSSLNNVYRVLWLKGWRCDGVGGSNKFINKGESHIMFHGWSPVDTVRQKTSAKRYLNNNTS